MPSQSVLRARVLQLLLDGEDRTRGKISRGLTRKAAEGVMVIATVTIKVKHLADAWDRALDQVLASLLQSGLVSCPRPGVYRITASGRRVAKANPGSLPLTAMPHPFAAGIEITLPRTKGGGGYSAGGMPGKGAGGFKLDLDDLGGLSGGQGPGAGGLGTGAAGTAGEGLGMGYGAGGKLPQKFTVKPVVTTPAADLALDAGANEPARAGPDEPGKLTPGGALPDHLLDDPRSVPVWYGTNRKPRNLEREADGFLGRPDEVMHYGYCMVNVPRGYVRGGSGKGWLLRFLTGEPTKLELGNINPLPEEKFWGSLGDTLRQQADADSLLLFVHGFRVSFEDAANSAGQLSYELRLPTAFFSWASHNRLLGYSADEDESGEAVDEFRKFLGQLAARTATAGKKLHIIAHSMGNRAVLQALHDIALEARPDGPRIAQVIFAAPDVSQRKFLRQLATIVSQPGLTAGRTLYAARDKALKGSGVLHVNTRAGYLPPVTTGPELETVDVSRYNLSWLGHSYCFRIPAVIADISDVLRGGAFLKRNRAPGGSHWVLG